MKFTTVGYHSPSQRWPKVMLNVVDRRNPAPPKKPWNDDYPLHANNGFPWFPSGANGFRPSTMVVRGPWSTQTITMVAVTYLVGSTSDHWFKPLFAGVCGEIISNHRNPMVIWGPTPVPKFLAHLKLGWTSKKMMLTRPM